MMRNIAALLLSTSLIQISACQITPEQIAAYRYEEDKKDVQGVMDYVKSNAELIREVGKIKEAHGKLSKTKYQERFPWRYIVVVTGDRTIFVAIDVSRSEDSVKYSVACFETPSKKRSYILEDMCKK